MSDFKPGGSGRRFLEQIALNESACSRIVDRTARTCQKRNMGCLRGGKARRFLKTLFVSGWLV